MPIWHYKIKTVSLDGQRLTEGFGQNSKEILRNRRILILVLLADHDHFYVPAMATKMSFQNFTGQPLAGSPSGKSEYLSF